MHMSIVRKYYICIVLRTARFLSIMSNLVSYLKVIIEIKFFYEPSPAS